jgi:predicted ATPase
VSSVVHDIMDRMTSALVGRDAELEQLCSTLGISASTDDLSSRAAVLLAGDAGVGKTRLLTELRDRAVDAGWRVLAGHCLDEARGLERFKYLGLVMAGCIWRFQQDEGFNLGHAHGAASEFL